MPRLPRINLIDISQHVIQRGNNRQACFFEDENYQVYLDKLFEYSQKYSVDIHAFVLKGSKGSIKGVRIRIKGVRSKGSELVDFVNLLIMN